MSRRRAAEKRNILPDHKFKDLVLAKVMNRIMLDGKNKANQVARKTINDVSSLFNQIDPVP